MLSRLISNIKCKLKKHDPIVHKINLEDFVGSASLFGDVVHYEVYCCRNCKKEYHYKRKYLDWPDYIVGETGMFSKLYEAYCKELSADNFNLTEQDLVLIDMLQPEFYEFAKLKYFKEVK